MVVSCTLLMLFVLLSACTIVWNRWKFYKLMFQFPGPYGLPLIGMAHKFRRKEDILPCFEDNIGKYGSVFFSWLGTIPFLVVSDPQICQDILTSPNCVNKGLIYKAIEDGTGNGLFVLKDPRWTMHRKLFNHAFSHKAIRNFIPLFNKDTRSLLNLMDNIADSGEKTDIFPIIQKFTLHIATQTTLGTESSCTEDFGDFAMLDRYHRILESMTEMCFSPWLLFRIIRRMLGREKDYAKAKQEVHLFMSKIINKKLEEEVNDGTNVTADMGKFLNIALSCLRRRLITMTSVHDESNAIVFGAFETTANTIVYTLTMLAMFPDVQEKAYQEVASLLIDTKDIDVDYVHTQQMKYLDLVLNEVMRVMAPVPLVSRQVSEDIRLSNGIIIPKGVQIAIDIFHMHRSKNIWGTEASKFNPDNFLPANFGSKHPYSFMPFTKGIRNCIGWHYALVLTKVTLATLIKRYRFSTSFNFDDLRFVEGITVKLKETPLLSIHRRTA